MSTTHGKHRWARWLVVAIFWACSIPGSEGNVQGQLMTGIGSVERLDSALDELMPADAKLDVLAMGFKWSEGPVWLSADGGFLLFSDVRTNTIFRWDATDGCRAYLSPSGYTSDVPRGEEMGSNGLAVDGEGRLIVCQHGDRRVARLDKPWISPRTAYVTLADRYDGNRFNSPNDVAVHSSGAVYFTDPPYGFEHYQDDVSKIPGKELPFQGVYRIATDGTVTLLSKELERPNGLAFSPDEKTLYVANSHGARPIWMAYPVLEDGTLGEGRVLFDATPLMNRQGMPDGLEVDVHGNLFATGPGGVLVISPEGKHLGTVMTGHATANCAFGEDGSSLFITADNFLMRIRVTTKGKGF